MEITLDNIVEQMILVLDRDGKDTAIRWYRQRLIDIISDGTTTDFDRKAAEYALAIWNEFHPLQLN